MAVLHNSVDVGWFVDRYAVASPFVSLRNCAAHEFHSASHFCGVVNKAPPPPSPPKRPPNKATEPVPASTAVAAFAAAAAVVNGASTLSSSSSSSSSKGRDDEDGDDPTTRGRGGIAAPAMTTAAAAVGAPGVRSGVDGEQGPALAITPRDPRKTFAVAAGITSTSSSVPWGDSPTPSLTSASAERAWASTTTQTTAVREQRPASPASMLWKLFYTHTCSTAQTPSRLGTSGFIKLLRAARVLRQPHQASPKDARHHHLVSEAAAVSK